jgi:hypothetical protein
MTRMVVLIVAGLVLVAAQAGAGAVLEVNASDFDGAAEGVVLYGRWDEATETYAHMHSRRLKDGIDRIGLAPGTYRVEVHYMETRPAQKEVREGIVVADGDELQACFRFAKATAEFRARDNDWPWGADTRIAMARWCDETGDYVPLHHMAQSDRRTVRHMHLAPGKYRARVQYLETWPQSEIAEEEFEIADGEVVSILSLFRHGQMPTRRKHAPLERNDTAPNLKPNEALTHRTDNKG